MLMDDSKNSGVMKRENGMIYDSFTWEEGETLASDIKEKIIQTLYKRFGGFLINKRTIDDIRCDSFVYRYGTVQQDVHVTQFLRGSTNVDGRQIPSIIDAKAGDTVIVIGFVKVQDSARVTSFVGIRVKKTEEAV